ncbi:hypothetical protein KQ940_01115 [Marinobacterium sp. D7]|uniref:hypothetical protein n=1 Tax=Marinobacterium ramblicola TaxID=2849041 RepID=UPI001C2D2ACC|nr:hypothetical protein [Marinobacterium ramblicola]MBV1786649.1 hypothetical protein [Marinobacterium ramblicola]
MLKVTKPPYTSPLSGRGSSGTAPTNSVFAEILAQEAARKEPDRQKQTQDNHSRSEYSPATSEEPIDAREELIKLLSMSSAERIRYLMLKDMGLTEETLAALPYEERQRIEQQIEQEIRRQLGSSFDESRDLRRV